MMDWLFSRTTIVILAVLGGTCAVIASWYQARGTASQLSLRRWNVIAYVLMAVSMILFIGAGLYHVAIGAGT